VKARSIESHVAVQFTAIVLADAWNEIPNSKDAVQFESIEYLGIGATHIVCKALCAE